LGNKIIRAIVVIVTSIVTSIIVFLLLTYIGVAPRIVKWLMVVSGYDFYQGETRSPYVFNFMLCILALIFIIVFYFLNRVLFKKRK